MKTQILLIVLLSAVSAPAFPEHMYGALALGNAAETDLSASGQTASGMSYSMLFGFHLDKNFAYEVAYTALLSNAAIANVATKKSTKGIEVAGVGNYPITGQFSIFARLGYANMDPAYSPGPVVENLIGFVYGLGAQYDVSSRIGVRAGYNIYNLGNSSTDSIINNAYVSVLYNF